MMLRGSILCIDGLWRWFVSHRGSAEAAQEAHDELGVDVQPGNRVLLGWRSPSMTVKKGLGNLFYD